MRVLLVAGALPPIRCGVGDYTSHLAEVLAKRGHCKPAVLTSSTRAESDQFQIIHGHSDCVHVRDAVAAIRRFRPDIVHIQYPTKCPVSNWLPVVVNRIFGVPVVQTWHEHYDDCVVLSWRNLLGLDALIYVREELPSKLPALVRLILRRKPKVHIPNVGGIRPVVLANTQRDSMRKQLAGDRAVVVFFGFAYPNKGVHFLFEIADPDLHHLVLICDLDRENAYQRELLQHADEARWQGKITITGFLPEADVASYLALADAVVFPFPSGIGPWNTSVLAAQDAGALVVGTTQDGSQLGFNAEKNMFLATCGDIVGMRDGLKRHLGHRKPAITPEDSWAGLAAAHESLYMRLR